MTDLKPCPFCGGEAEMDTQRHYRMLVSGNLGNACAIYCLTCEADISICLEDVPGWTIEEAAARVVDRWNTRAHDSASFEAGERSMRERAAAKALEIGNVFRARNQSSYAEGYDDGTSCAASAIRALPTGEQNAED